MNISETAYESRINESSPITVLNGIGTVRAGCFASAGIFTLGDLVAFYPRSYQFRGDVRPLSEGDTERDCSYYLKVSTVPSLHRVRGNLSILRFRAVDEVGDGVCEITYFNMPYLKDQIKVGGVYRFFGRLTAEKGRFKLTNPTAEAVIEGVSLPNIVPVYPTVKGVSAKALSDAVAAAVRQISSFVPDYLPEEIRRRESLSTLPYALRGVHTPESRENLEAAVKRLRFDELFIFALCLRISRSRRTEGKAPAFSNTNLSGFFSSLPFEPTGAQKRAVSDIVRDVSGKTGALVRPMSRIVSGDVGSGKTAVAAAAAVLAMQNGFQAALMAPTEILAAQHYKELSPMFARMGFSSALLTGSSKAAERREILAGLGDGSIDFAVGTHALFSRDVSFRNAALFITDEQHRFGVMQRSALSGKGDSPHVLVMSATPIPRTLALAMYGDLDISPLDELPPGRQRVDTFVVDSSYRERLDAFILKQISGGHRVYIVCPTVEEKETEEGGSGEIATAVEFAKELKKRLPDAEIGTMHGRLPSSEKDAVMADFAAGKINVLVSTTVIEVGVNVPEATLMIVENAERFGLSQLHQLRGRVGRGKDKSYCVLVSDSKGGSAAERLEVMRTTYDGYKIAERDLALRGPGDFFADGAGGFRQHGAFRLAFGGDSADGGEIARAFSDAERLLADSPKLDAPGLEALSARVDRILGSAEDMIN